MSLTGNFNYSNQNLENKNHINDNLNDIYSKLTDINYNSFTDTTSINNNVIIGTGKTLVVDGLNIKNQINTNTNNINTNTNNINTINQKITDITYDTPSDTTSINNNVIVGTGKTLVVDSLNIKNQINTNTNNINTNTNNINSINTKLTDLSYDSSSDTTIINNNLKLTNNYGTSDFTPQFIINNPNMDSGGIYNYETYMISGSLVGNYNPIVKASDTVIFNRKEGLVETGSGISLTSHSTTKYGLRVDVNGGTSELKCSNFDVDSNLTLTSGKTLIVDGLNIKYQVDINTDNITTNSNDINTINQKITDITYDTPSDTTTISNNVTIPTGKILTVPAIILNGSDLTTTINNIDLTYGGKLTNFTTGPAAPRLEISGAQLTLATNINMNGSDINNIRYLYVTSGSNVSEIRQNSTSLWIRNNQDNAAIQLINLTSSGSMSRTLGVSYADVNFDNRTLSNCPTLTAINDNINTLTAMRIRAQCRITCNSGTYSMDWNNNNTFRAFVGSGLFISKISNGRFTLLVDVNTGITDTNFTIHGSGTNNVNATTGGDNMIISTTLKSAYYSSGVLLGYTFDIITTKTNTPDSRVDIGNDGYLDFIVVR